MTLSRPLRAASSFAGLKVEQAARQLKRLGYALRCLGARELTTVTAPFFPAFTDDGEGGHILIGIRFDEAGVAIELDPWVPFDLIQYFHKPCLPAFKLRDLGDDAAEQVAGPDLLLFAYDGVIYPGIRQPIADALLRHGYHSLARLVAGQQLPDASIKAGFESPTKSHDGEDLGLIDNQITDREPPSGARLIMTLWAIAILGVAFAVWRLLEALVLGVVL